MKKLFLALVLFLSFAGVSRSDPPEGYQYRPYYFCVKNYQGQFILNATATVSDTSWLDMGASNLTPDNNGYINLFFLVPSDPDVAPSINGIQVTFSAPGYQDCVYYLDDYTIISIFMPTS
jgi:hypothetical protein